MDRTELFLICLVPIVATAYDVPPSAMNSASSDVTFAKVRCLRISGPGP